MSALKVMQDAPGDSGDCADRGGARVAGLARLPGEATRGAILQAREDGFTERKFFPARLRASIGRLFDIKFCPTGGVTLKNAFEFLALPNWVCVGGSWLVPAQALAVGDWTRMTRLATDARDLARTTRPQFRFRALLGVGLSPAPTLKLPRGISRISGANLVRYIKLVL